MQALCAAENRVPMSRWADAGSRQACWHTKMDGMPPPTHTHTCSAMPLFNTGVLVHGHTMHGAGAVLPACTHSCLVAGVCVVPHMFDGCCSAHVDRWAHTDLQIALHVGSHHRRTQSCD